MARVKHPDVVVDLSAIPPDKARERFAILRAVKKAMKLAGKTDAQVEAMQLEAVDGKGDRQLEVCAKYVTIRGHLMTDG